MKKLIIALALVSFAFANNCNDWINNSDNCLIDTVSTIPRFSNTEEIMTAGSSACRTNNKYYTIDSIIQNNGLMIRYKLPQKICRDIIDVSRIKIPHTERVRKISVDRNCCDRSWEFTAKSVEYSYRQQCYKGILSMECQEIKFVDSVYFTYSYQITYSDSAKITYDYSTEKARIELIQDYFVDGNIIEIYRNDGTLKYSGELTYIPGDLEHLPTYKTRGWCWNKRGTKTVRKTNNVSLCK